MAINIIAMGKLKEDYLKAASSEYEKRIRAFSKVNIIELPPEKLPENPASKLIEQALYKESVQIQGKIPNSSYVFALCSEGTSLSSEGFSEKLSKLSAQGKSDFCFIIGSSHGLAEQVKENADMKLSMSGMTFPHQLARIMLLEQLYRAFSIWNNGKYHK